PRLCPRVACRASIDARSRRVNDGGPVTGSSAWPRKPVVVLLRLLSRTHVAPERCGRPGAGGSRMPEQGEGSKCGWPLVATGFDTDKNGQTVFHYKCQTCGQTATKTMK